MFCVRILIEWPGPPLKKIDHYFLHHCFKLLLICSQGHHIRCRGGNSAVGGDGFEEVSLSLSLLETLSA